MGSTRRTTDAQVQELRRWVLRGASLKKAALRADMDRKTARKYRDRGQLPSEARRPHTWRTRSDPLAAVWPRLEELLAGEPRLQAKTLWEWLQREYPGQYAESVRRTLERRVHQWKARQGPAKEVFFAQVHEPGRLGASDFTHLDSLQVTIQGEALPHLVYHFVLTHSNWEHVTLCFSESFASLSDGLQNALAALGGVPHRHRTDRMTLAVHQHGQAEEFTAKYRALLAHYGLEAEATNPHSGHENGDCEQGHRRLKEALEQELLLRGSRDFVSREAYWHWVLEVVRRRNASRGEKLQAELACLQPLPPRRLESLERLRLKVSRGSTIRVKKNVYSVPARLIGEVVEVRLGAVDLEVWYAQELVQRVERLRGQDKHRIDYRHLSSWLVRKPGAFARYCYREDLYPTLTFRRAYDALVVQRPARADKEYVGLLHLASQEGEARVEAALAQLLEAGRSLSLQGVQTLLGQETSLAEAARVVVAAVDLQSYDDLLEGSHGLAAEAACGLPICVHGRSVLQGEEAGGHGQGCESGAEPLFAATASAGHAVAVRGGGTPGGHGVVDVCGVPAGTGPGGMSAASGAAHRAAAEGIEAALGEELVGVGPEVLAGEGGAATARAAERGLPRSPGECARLWAPRCGQNACLVGGGSGTGAFGSAAAEHDLLPAGPGIAGGQARPIPEGAAETAGALGGDRDRRSGLCATEPRGDGSAVHAAGGALRTGQRVVDQQSALLGLGTDLQGSDDHGGGHRSSGPSQRDRGVECTELSDGRGEESEGESQGGVSGSVVGPCPGRGPGCATLTVAALRLAPLRQAHALGTACCCRGSSNLRSQGVTSKNLPAIQWGMIIVAQGER